MLDFIARFPVLHSIARKAVQAGLLFSNSERYWIDRYRIGGNSGRGSTAKLADFKADVVNRFVASRNVLSVIEFGCGDGQQLLLARYPRYAGYDISSDVIARCRDLFAADESKSFGLMADYRGGRAELALSLDVIYHLVEDDVYHGYMQTLFDASDRFVVIYSSNTDDAGLLDPHIRHRRFTDWVEQCRPEWKLVDLIRNPHPVRMLGLRGSFADFFIFERSK
ncbi:MAG: methyltransferase domain-containing protein [Bacteroidota bacterium]